MVILKKKDFYSNVTLKYIIDVDKRDTLYHAVKLLGLVGCSQMNKRELAEAISDELLQHPEWALGLLPQDELELVKRLVAAGPNTYVEAPVKERFYLIQKLYMVFSYEDKANNTYLMMMPDEVREACANHIDNVSRSIPFDKIEIPTPQHTKAAKKKTDDILPHKPLLEIIKKYTPKGQAIILLAFDLVNMQTHEMTPMPVASYFPYNQDADILLEKVVAGASDKQLSTCCDLILMDIDRVCDILDPKTMTEKTMFGYAILVGVMGEILKQVAPIPPTDYAKFLKYKIKGDRVYHFAEIEKIANNAMKSVSDMMQSDFIKFLATCK